MSANPSVDPWARKNLDIDPWESPYRKKYERALVSRMTGEDCAFDLAGHHSRRRKQDCAFDEPEHGHPARSFARPAAPVSRPGYREREGRRRSALPLIIAGIIGAVLLILLGAALFLLFNSELPLSALPSVMAYLGMENALPFLALLVFLGTFVVGRKKNK